MEHCNRHTTKHLRCYTFHSHTVCMRSRLQQQMFQPGTHSTCCASTGQSRPALPTFRPGIYSLMDTDCIRWHPLHMASLRFCLIPNSRGSCCTASVLSLHRIQACIRRIRHTSDLCTSLPGSPTIETQGKPRMTSSPLESKSDSATHIVQCCGGSPALCCQWNR